MIDHPLFHTFVPGPAYAEMGWMDTLLIMGVGFLLVVAVLSILASVTAVIGKLFERFHADVVKDRSVTQLRVEDGEKKDDSKAVVAAISAALHVYLEGRSHRILSITRNPPGWAQEGRRQIFSSHRIR